MRIVDHIILLLLLHDVYYYVFTLLHIIIVKITWIIYLILPTVTQQ